MTADAAYVVIDTNVVIYFITRSPLAERFEPYLIGKTGVVSFQTVGELRLIAKRRGWGERKVAELEERLRRLVVVPSTDQITERWAELMYKQTVAGSRILPADAWIAATALVYGCPLLTNDRKDFERITGLELLPPAEGA